jgi:uncharacterized protein YbaR (Trm112 family)
MSRTVPSTGDQSRKRDAPAPGADRLIEPKMLDLLVCPRTHGPLIYDRDAQELISQKARLAFPVRDGVPILLTAQARTLED